MATSIYEDEPAARSDVALASVRTVAPGEAGTPPIKVVAFFGALTLGFIAYVWIRWITGPYFKRVEPGPTHAPGWMTTTFVVWQAAGVVAAAACVWFFLIRPWRRDRRISTDGLLAIARSVARQLLGRSVPCS